MRTPIASSVLAFALVLLSVGGATSGCQEPDPNLFETHVERIKVPAERARGFLGLEQLTKDVMRVKDNKALLDEFAEKVVPVFEQIWDEAPEQHENMLVLLREVGHPSAASVWSKAIKIDGSADARKKTVIALDGIAKARAKDTAPALIAQIEKLIEAPRLDQSESEPGELRKKLAETLGAIRDPRGVDVLIKLLEQTQETQPVIVHRVAAEALGKIGDPKAIDALLTVQFRVPDATVSTNIGERVKIALAGIGEPAVPKLLLQLRGEHTEVQKLAAENGVPQSLIQQSAIGSLGVVGSKAAAEDLIKFFPKDDCTEAAKAKPPQKKAESESEGEEGQPEIDSIGLRAFTASALGLIGEPAAAEAICGCLGVSKQPDDTFESIQALGRVGGPKAVECLAGFIKTGEYDPEYDVDKDLVLQPRWDSARFAILAADVGQLPVIQAAIQATTDARVKEELVKWQPGIDLLTTCKDDKGCYLKTLGDVNADWFAREKAAFELARLAKGDLDVAVEVAKAYKVRSPDARVSIAWLVPRIADGKPCPACIEAFESVLSAEKSSTDKAYQSAVLTVRYSLAKLDRVPDAS